MKISAKALPGALKKQLFPVYWISGDDPLLKDEAKKSILSYLNAQGFVTKISFQLKVDFNLEHFLSELKNYSIFADKKYLELELNDRKLPENLQKVLLEFSQSAVAESIVVIKSDKLDSGTQNRKWFKSLEASMLFVQVWPLNQNEVFHWIQMQLREKGMQTDQQGISLLYDNAEGNLLALSQDIEKLHLQYGSGKIPVDAIATAVSENARYDIFLLVDTCLNGDNKKCLKILRQLRLEAIEPILILWALAKDIRLLVNLKLSTIVLTDGELRKKGIWPKRIPYFKKALQQHDLAAVKSMLMQCYDIDKAIKGVMAIDVWLALEQLSLQLAGTRLCCND